MLPARRHERVFESPLGHFEIMKSFRRHGHVKLGKVLARCGGPALCETCQLEELLDRMVSAAKEADCGCIFHHSDSAGCTHDKLNDVIKEWEEISE